MSIRIKLLLVGLLFMGIPLMVYQFISDMQQLLQKGQEQALLLEAKAIASVLHERQELFSKDTGIILNQKNSSNLYAQAKVKPIKIDGSPDDWAEILHNAQFFGKDNQISGTPPTSDQDLSFWHLLAYDNDFIYGLFQVSDDQLDFRDKESLNLAQSDHLRLYLSNDSGANKYYILNTKEAGTMSAYEVKKDWQTPITGQHDPSFFAHLRQTDSGYNIELRIPLDLVMNSQHMAFAVVDYYQKNSKIISTIDPEKDPKLNRILLRSPHLDNILSGLDKPNGRIWVVDSFQRVRAVTGSLRSQKIQTSEPSWIDSLLSTFFKNPNYEFTDYSKDIDILTNQSIVDALNKKPNTFVRQSIDDKVTILSAVAPIESNNKIVGAVVVEQTNNNILVLENKALLSVTKQIATIFLLAIFTIIWFAIRLTYRINRLHQETNEATIESGKIKTDAKITVHSKDELGKLAESIATMLASLSQHTLYLERMPRTLRHEILNPLSVISMSIENFKRIAKPTDQEQKYLTSAQNGIKRLGAILHSLTEATNLESALVSEEKVLFDLVALLDEYMTNYQALHPNNQFQIIIPNEPLFMMGWPESIAQMLDKILDNSVDFSEESTVIKVALKEGNPNCMYISNEGKHIPVEIQDNIFESMVSKRSDKYKQKPHLGIGLYVARVIAEAHNGIVSFKNTNYPKGVQFTICFSSKTSAVYQKSF